MSCSIANALARVDVMFRMALPRSKKGSVPEDTLPSLRVKADAVARLRRFSRLEEAEQALLRLIGDAERDDTE